MANCAPESEFEQLPELYQRWVEELLPGAIPREREATCFDCVMCDRGQGAPVPGMGFYHPETKCCTYFPEVPNFLVGRALAVDTAGGDALRAFVAGAEAHRAQATLLGVRPAPKISTVYRQHKDDLFGRDPEMRCPYAITPDPAAGPICGIWKHRNSICSTWFCKHVKGYTGFQFWYVLQGLLGSLEWSLAWWAITQVLDNPAAALMPAQGDATSRNKVSLRPDAWSRWSNTRTSFYEACAEAVAPLSAREVLEIGGMEARLHLLDVEARFAHLHDSDPPEHMRTASYSILKRDENHAVLKAARYAQPFEAPAVLLSVLHYFDGRPTDAVLEAIHADTRVRLSTGIVRRLYDFGILELADDTAASPEVLH